jgi:hypothetical protein
MRKKVLTLLLDCVVAFLLVNAVYAMAYVIATCCKE